MVSMVPPGRRARRLQRAGNFRVDELGLPAARAQELLLAHAWPRVVGEGIARRVTALRVRRGVLELEVPSDSWAKTLGPLLPRLAGRLAADYPELAVHSFRLRRGGDGPPAGVQSIDGACATTTTRAEIDSREQAAASGGAPEKEPPWTVERIAGLVDRYLERGGGR